MRTIGQKKRRQPMKNKCYAVWLEGNTWIAIPHEEIQADTLYMRTGGNWFGSSGLPSPEAAIEEAKAYYSERDDIPIAIPTRHLQGGIPGRNGLGIKRSARISFPDTPSKGGGLWVDAPLQRFYYKGFVGEYNPEEAHGILIFINDVVTFRGKEETAEEEFRRSVDDYEAFLLELGRPLPDDLLPQTPEALRERIQEVERALEEAPEVVKRSGGGPQEGEYLLVLHEVLLDYQRKMEGGE